MSTYWISFRLGDIAVGGKSYSDRWDALNAAVVAASVGTNYWSKTSSFFVFVSDYSIGQLGARFKAVISPAHDLFLMRSLDTKSAVVCGKNDDADIFTLMPYLEKI
jgi:hypothetical protein